MGKLVIVSLLIWAIAYFIVNWLFKGKNKKAVIQTAIYSTIVTAVAIGLGTAFVIMF